MYFSCFQQGHALAEDKIDRLPSNFTLFLAFSAVLLSIIDVIKYVLMHATSFCRKETLARRLFGFPYSRQIFGFIPDFWFWVYFLVGKH